MDVLTIIYRDKSVLRYVHDKVEEVSHLITNIEALESSIYSQLVKYYKTTSTRSIKRIKFLIDREIALARKRYGIQDVTMFSDLSVINDFGESLEFEPADLLAQGSETVLENISLKEKIACLAADDRELVTLNAWAYGYNDSQVSETLARHFGGKSESHRKFVQRFKVKCQRKLTA